MIDGRYHLSRQKHLGDFLDRLQALGHLTWIWRYDYDNSRAIFIISVDGNPSIEYLIRPAERIAQSIADREKITWIPVAHPGGEQQLAEAQAEIAAMETGHVAPNWTTVADIEEASR